jgi:6-carboxyhexanoate--CoA ligase
MKNTRVKRRRRLLSLRMRASRRGRHLSGAERLLSYREIPAAVCVLLRRAVEHVRGRPDEVVITADPIPAAAIRRVAALPVSTVQVESVAEGREAALRILRHLGVSRRAAAGALEAMARGPGPGGTVMRGAMVVDARSGKRLEPDSARGIRARRMDWTPEASRLIEMRLRPWGLPFLRVSEALAVATKVAHAPGVVAELCWSDDPDYAAGYVASKRLGYVRIPRLKPLSEQSGGRAIFLSPGGSLERLFRFLRETPVLLIEAASVKPPLPWEAWQRRLSAPPMAIGGGDRQG